MKTSTEQDARSATNKTKARVAGSILMWLFSGAYTVSPIDLIPDIIPVLGFADDFFVLLVAAAFTVYTISSIRAGRLGRRQPTLTEPQRVAIDVQEAVDGYAPPSLPKTDRS